MSHFALDAADPILASHRWQRLPRHSCRGSSRSTSGRRMLNAAGRPAVRNVRRAHGEGGKRSAMPRFGSSTSVVELASAADSAHVHSRCAPTTAAFLLMRAMAAERM